MKTVVLDVASLDDVASAVLATLNAGESETEARISFATPELLWKVLTAKRWEIIRAMAGQGPISLRETARRVNRDVKGVHTDVHALLDAGLIVRADDGHFEFPYENVRVEFLLRAA